MVMGVYEARNGDPVPAANFCDARVGAAQRIGVAYFSYARFGDQ